MVVGFLKYSIYILRKFSIIKVKTIWNILDFNRSKKKMKKKMKKTSNIIIIIIINKKISVLIYRRRR